MMDFFLKCIAYISCGGRGNLRNHYEAELIEFMCHSGMAFRLESRRRCSKIMSRPDAVPLSLVRHRADVQDIQDCPNECILPTAESTIEDKQLDKFQTGYGASCLLDQIQANVNIVVARLEQVPKPTTLIMLE